jgi:type II secretory pathway pseudopilin PulG
MMAANPGPAGRRSIRRSPALAAACGSEGVTLLEVLVTALVLGLAAVGLALMYSMGNTFVVAKGDNRVALGLAQQKIEQVKALALPGTIDCIPIGGPGALNTPQAPPASCTLTAPPAQPRTYNESPVPLTTGGTGRYSRLTCVQYVANTNFDANPFTGMATCTPGAISNALRITVIVTTPNQQESDPVVVQTWVTPQGP